MFKKINKLPKSEIELEFEINAEEFNSFVKKSFREISQNLEVKGFRKGTVPENIAKEHINQQAVLSKAAEQVAQKEYDQYLSENNIDPISYPELIVDKLAENNEFLFKIKVTVLPDLDLPDYKNIAKKVDKKTTEVKDQEIIQTLEWIQKTRAKKIIKQGAAERGDLVEIEYYSPETKEQKDTFLLGEGKLIPGFEEYIIGMNAGEEKKEIRITLPVNHNIKEMAGKEIIFKIKLINVYKMEIPELTDDFAKSIGEFKNIENLKENVKQGIQQEKEQGEKERRRSEILQQIAEKTKVEIPSILIEKEQKNLINNLKEQVKNRMNLSFEDYLNQIKKTEKEVSDSLLIEAEKRVKQFLILKEITKLEKVEATEEEIKKESDIFLKKYKSTPEAKQDIDEDKLRVYTEEAVKNEKVLQLLESA